MEVHKRGCHTVWDCKCLGNKDRYPCFVAMLGFAANDFARERGRMRWSCTPGRSIATMSTCCCRSIGACRCRALCNIFEGPQTLKLLSEFAMLRMRCGAQHLWARRYWGD